MLASVNSATVIGLDAFHVRVEVDITTQTVAFHLVGLPGKALRESQERVESAIRNSDLEFPQAHIVVNLAPADLMKDGPGFDLPIAVGVLAANFQLPQERLSELMLVGELGLDGQVRSVAGVLPVVMKAREMGLKGVVVPKGNAREAAMIPGIEVFGVSHLAEVVQWLRGNLKLCPEPVTELGEFELPASNGVDFAEVRGQEHAKRALEIAAAGHHNLLMIGPPGSGKTMLARRLPTILPPLTVEEALEVTRIYSVSGLLSHKGGLIRSRPFRAPHHTVSLPGLVGGGTIPKPGEVSLAHHGVLFLDEMLEFPRSALEIMRQPLEDGVVTISRANMTLTFPCRFLLVGATNPCPCGFLGDPMKECRCGESQIRRYWKRLSGPLMDRIDIVIEVARLEVEKLARGERVRGESPSPAPQEVSSPSEEPAAVALAEEELPQFGEPSASIRERVSRARQIQLERYRGLGISCNAHLSGRLVDRFCLLDEAGLNLLTRAVDRLGLSARAYQRIKKVARTIADLEGSEHIRVSHVAEAIQYRAAERVMSR